MSELESPYPHRHDSVARVYEDGDGRLWVTHQELLSNGYQSVEPSTIVFLNQTFFEVEGYSSTADAWWISQINPEAEFDDVPVLSESNGDEAEEA